MGAKEALKMKSRAGQEGNGDLYIRGREGENRRNHMKERQTDRGSKGVEKEWPA